MFTCHYVSREIFYCNIDFVTYAKPLSLHWPCMFSPLISKCQVLWIILLFVVSWSGKLWTVGKVNFAKTFHISRLVTIKMKSHRIMETFLNLHFLYSSNIDTEKTSLANYIKCRIYICFVKCWRYASSRTLYSIQHSDAFILAGSYSTKQIISIILTSYRTTYISTY